VVTDEERRVRSDSDDLLAAVDEMRRTEREKRGEEMSSPPFHRLADEVEGKARRVWEIARQENRDGEQVQPSDTSIDETPREQLD
jgi:hypothetical protein